MGTLITPVLNRYRIIGDTVLNLAGQGIPLLIGIVAVPFIIRGLGAEGFGLFSLALAVLGTFGVLDFGLPRATTKFLTECLSHNDTGQFNKTFWTSILIQSFLGLASGALLLSLIPWLAGAVLKVPAAMVGETKLVLLLIALQIPFVLLTSCARGALEAGHKFRITNALKIPLISMMYIIPVIALWLGAGLVQMLWSILLVRILLSCLHLLVCVQVYPSLLHFTTDVRLIRPLLAFGGSVLIASMMATVMGSIDRFFIAAIQTTREVGFYSAPVDTVIRLLILPTSFITVLFPTFSALDASPLHDNDERLSRMFSQSLKFLMLLMTPVAMCCLIFAHQILRLWLGPAFADQSTTVFQIASLAVLVGSLGWIPYTLLQAIGRPDLPAKFMLFETPFIIFLLWVLIHRFGFVGAAIAWLVRITAETWWFFWALSRVRGGVFKRHSWFRARAVFPSILVFTFISGCMMYPGGHNLILAHLTVFGLLLLLYGWFCWSRLLEPSERLFLLSFRSRVRPFDIRS